MPSSCKHERPPQAGAVVGGWRHVPLCLLPALLLCACFASGALACCVLCTSRQPSFSAQRTALVSRPCPPTSSRCPCRPPLTARAPAQRWRAQRLVGPAPCLHTLTVQLAAGGMQAARRAAACKCAPAAAQRARAAHSGGGGTQREQSVRAGCSAPLHPHCSLITALLARSLAHKPSQPSPCPSACRPCPGPS